MTLLEGGYLVPFVVPLTAVLLWALRRRGWSAGRLGVVIALAIYLSGVAMQTLFPIMVGDVTGRQPVALRDIVHVRLFEAVFNSAGNRQQAFLNVVLGIPLGVLLPLVGVRSAWKVIVLGLLFAIGIEGLQLVEDVVYRTEFRTVDINDVMFNWLGVAIGLTVYLLAAVGFSSWPRRARGDLPDRG